MWEEHPLYNTNEMEEHKKNVKEQIYQLINANQLNDAWEIILKYQEIIKNDIEIEQAKSMIYIAEGKYEKAKRILKDLIKLDGFNSDTYYNLGYIYYIERNFTEAYKFYELAKHNCCDNELINEINNILLELSHVKKDVNGIKKTDLKKVLILAHIFPPIGGSGVQRTLKFVKYLQEFGWEPIVVTAGKSNYPLIDETLVLEVPKGLRVIRIDEDFTLNAEVISEIYTLFENMNINKELLQSYQGDLVQNINKIIIPDLYILWANKVLKELNEFIDVSELDLIYSTSGPYSDHIIGYHIKDQYNKPWIVDFRDEWTNNPYSKPDKNSLAYKINFALEEKIVNTADKIITVTPKSNENYQNIFELKQEKVVTITNGYDEEDFKKLDINIHKNDKFTIVHNGLFYGIRNPHTFLISLNNLIENGLIDKSKVKVFFSWSENDKDWFPYIGKFQLESVVEFFGYISHEESLQLASIADLLLLIVGPGVENKVTYPGKLFEYLRLEKTILALSPINSEVDNLIKKFKAGYNADFEDIKSIEDYLLKEYNSWLNKSNNKRKEYKNYKIEKFERRNLTGNLSDLFNTQVSRVISNVNKPKIAFFSIRTGDKFLHDIISGLSKKFKIRKIIVTDLKQIDEGMKWADICWFEWCDQLIAYGSSLSLAKEKKIICRLHSYEVFYGDFLKNVVWENIDKVIFVANFIRDIALKQAQNLTVGQTVHIPNGINIEKFAFKEKTSGYKIAYVCSVDFKKGPMLLLHAFKSIFDQDSRYELHIAGEFIEPRYELYYEQMVKELGLEKNVFYNGWQMNIKKWLEDKNYIISTSVLESQHLAIMEAMAMGIKPLVHNFYGAREVYDNRFIWNTIDEAVEMIIDNSYESHVYRRFIEENYSLEDQLVLTENVIDSLIQEPNHIDDIFSFKYKEETISFYLPNQKDYIQYTIRNSKGFYESEMLEDIYLRDITGKNVVDVGANIGNHSIFFSKVSKAKAVYCFEPFKKVFNILKKNIEINNLGEKVKAFNLAAGDISGKAIIDIVDDSNLGMSKVCQAPNGDIDVVMLDEVLLPIVDAVDIMKIDVEGMGLAVLHGSIQIIKFYKPDIYIEAETDTDYQKILEFLSQYDYRPVKRYNWTPTYLFTTTFQN